MPTQDELQIKSPLFLAVDGCGRTGTVALSALTAEGCTLLGEKSMDGRTFSATLMDALRALMDEAGVRLSDLSGLVAVNGPGSFTGVRIGTGAVKGLAEATGLPLLAVSRLAVIAATHGIEAAALDAHRNEIYLLLGGETSRELLAGQDELAAETAPARIAVCEDASAALLQQCWPQVEILRVADPTAADALRLAAPRLLAGEQVDVARLDGHYLRRSDAEIFGDPANAGKPRG